MTKSPRSNVRRVVHRGATPLYRMIDYSTMGVATLLQLRRENQPQGVVHLLNMQGPTMMQRAPIRYIGKDF